MIIYKITNKINGKVYIGQTIKTLKTRWKQHCSDKKGYCRLLHNAILKYGKENFTVEQIDIACTRDELDKKEVYWIKFYNSMSREKGYNLLGGGNKKHTVSAETRKRLSEAGKGRICSEYAKQVMRLLRTGKPKPKEQVEKMRKTKILLGVHKGEKNWFYGKKGGKHPTAKAVVNETLNKYFETAILAALSVGAKDSSCIVKCCKGKRKTAYGYVWRYANGK